MSTSTGNTAAPGAKGAAAGSADDGAGFDRIFSPYFEGLRTGRLRVQWCQTCERTQWPPRSICTGCHSRDIGWTDVADPTGTVFSWTVVHHAKGTPFEADVPYAVAVVELDHNSVRMFAHIADPQDLAIGAPVTIDFEHRTELDHPTWRLLSEHDSG